MTTYAKPDPSILEIARAARRWPVIEILENHYRRAPVVCDLEPVEGPVVVTGEITGEAARNARGLLFVGDQVAVRRESAVALLEEGNIEGQLVYAMGVMRLQPDVRGPFESYRKSPRIPMLTETTCLMDAPSWAYFRAGAFRRGLYLTVGAVADITGAMRAWLRGSVPAATAVAAALAVTAAVVTALSASFGLPPPSQPREVVISCETAAERGRRASTVGAHMVELVGAGLRPSFDVSALVDRGNSAGRPGAPSPSTATACGTVW